MWSLPITTEWMKTQEYHTPSMEYAKDIYKVTSTLPKGFVALEIGMAWGFSTLAILEAGAKHLTSVDPNIMAHGADESKANGYTNHVWTAQKSEAFWNENPSITFDFIYVDGSHLYKDVRNDLYQAWDRLSKNGVLAIDDWEHKNNIKADLKSGESEYGVSLACWEFWRDHKDTITGKDILGRVLWFKK